jgi:hypothetical protein
MASTASHVSSSASSSSSSAAASVSVPVSESLAPCTTSEEFAKRYLAPEHYESWQKGGYSSVLHMEHLLVQPMMPTVAAFLAGRFNPAARVQIDHGIWYHSLTCPVDSVKTLVWCFRKERMLHDKADHKERVTRLPRPCVDVKEFCARYLTGSPHAVCALDFAMVKLEVILLFLPHMKSALFKTLNSRDALLLEAATWSVPPFPRIRACSKTRSWGLSMIRRERELIEEWADVEEEKNQPAKDPAFLPCRKSRRSHECNNMHCYISG